MHISLSLSLRRTNFLPSELQYSHHRPKAASPSENPNNWGHLLAPETETDTAAFDGPVPRPQSRGMGHSEAGVSLTIIMGAGGASPPHLRLMYGLQRWLEHALYSLHLLPIRMLLQMHSHPLWGNRVTQPVHQPLSQSRHSTLPQSVTQMGLFSRDFYFTYVTLTYVCIQSSNLQNQP